MIRFTLAFLVVAVVAVLAAWLANQPGTITIDWQGYRIEASLLILAAAVLAVLAASLVVYRSWLWMRRGPARIGELRAADRRRRGFLALTQGLTAVAAGDAPKARRYAQRAEVLLDEPPLTLLLSAQAAQLSGDAVATTRHFTAMLENPETEFLGLRGLLSQAEREGDQERALKLARRAHEKSPGAPWVIRALFDLEVEAGNWRESELLLKRPAEAIGLAPDRARRALSISRYQQAREAAAKQRWDIALRIAREVHKLTPSFVPGAVLLAEAASHLGKRRVAQAALLASWARHPHPDLWAAYRGLADNEPAAALAKRVEKLVAGNPSHRESRIVLAQPALASQQWARARAALEPLVAKEAAPPDAQICTLMAALEEGEHGADDVVRIWRERTIGAAQPARWVCRACHTRLEDWTPHCPQCQRFDSLNAFADDEGEVVSLEGTDTAVVAAPDPGRRVPSIMIGGLADTDLSDQRDLRERF
ncbi:MAG: hypothetical protein O3A21_00735 [Proteobacteria bacterium]|nr:hypothetical protein [Pseudomonadota bacterium]